MLNQIKNKVIEVINNRKALLVGNLFLFFLVILLSWIEATRIIFAPAQMILFLTGSLVGVFYMALIVLVYIKSDNLFIDYVLWGLGLALIVLAMAVTYRSMDIADSIIKSSDFDNIYAPYIMNIASVFIYLIPLEIVLLFRNSQKSRSQYTGIVIMIAAIILAVVCLDMFYYNR